MRLRWKAYTICKEGNREEENEDASFPVLHNGVSLKVDDFSCALADGATQSSFAKRWAELLVSETGMKKDLPKEILPTVANAKKIWGEEIAGKVLSWPAEIKVRQGAFATLLWFHIQDNNKESDPQVWNAMGIGDTCLFHIRANHLISGFPLTAAAQFSNTPNLVSTNLVRNSALFPVKPFSRKWESGDEFLLATDALACYVYKLVEEDNKNDLSAFKSHIGSKSEFIRWISHLRNMSSIKNDDTTMIWLSVF